MIALIVAVVLLIIGIGSLLLSFHIRTKSKRTIKPENTRAVWARIGMTLYVTEKEYQELLTIAELEGEVVLDEKEALRFVKEGFVDGDCYIPVEAFD